jgi:hypothetical protein
VAAAAITTSPPHHGDGRAVTKDGGAGAPPAGAGGGPWTVTMKRMSREMREMDDRRPSRFYRCRQGDVQRTRKIAGD